HPVLGNVVRGVRGTRSVVDEKRPVRRDRLLLAHVGDRLVREVFVEGVVVLAAPGHFHLDGRGAVVEGRLPLVGLAADEAVEVVKSLHVWPAVERAGDAGLPVGDVVVLAEERGAVAVLADDLRYHRTALGNLPGVAGEAAAEFGDATGGRGVMVAARE